MKIGISVPNNWGVEDANQLIDLAVLAEDLGFTSVWTSEHLINLAYVRARIGERPYHHPLAILSCIAGRTKRIQLATSVIVLPFHNPFDIAKYVATLDQLSKGRVVLGVGVGNVPEEFAALNVPANKRGAITDESIDILQLLWTQQSASYAGNHWNFSDVYTSPKPYQGRRLPILIGGMSDAAYKRVARAGDGWQPTGISAEQFKEAADQIRTLTKEAGRDPSSLEMCMRFNIALDGQGVTETELRATVERGDYPRALQIAKDFEAAGATHFIFALNGNEWPVLEEAARGLAKHLLPHFA